MRNSTVLLVLGLVPGLGFAGKTPPPKEWQPVIEATDSAFRNGDAAALAKLLASWVELGTTCATKAPTAQELAEAEAADKQRLEVAASAIRDCRPVDWNKAKLVGAEGGEPESTRRCEQLQFPKGIVLHYTGGFDFPFTIELSPVLLNGKRLLTTVPRCHTYPKKK